MHSLGEDLIDCFNDDLLSVSKLGPLTDFPTKIAIQRTKNFELELEVTFPGWRDQQAVDVPAGAFYQGEDFIEFSSPSGAIYKASGVIELDHSSSSSAAGMQTICHYVVHKIEMRTPIAEKPSYVIEWVGNLSKRLVGNSSLKTEDTEGADLQFGEGVGSIKINNFNKRSGFSRILHVNINGIEIYIVNTRDTDQQKTNKSGYILYKGFVSLADRNKMRECISFIFGLPIVMFGYTEFSACSVPIYMESFPVYAFGGRIFELPDLPPYPVASGSFRNMPNIVVLEKALNALYVKYDELRFDELYWTYWHGVCASVTMSAVYFGGLCEQLQRIVRRTSDIKGEKLICEKKWQEAKKDLLAIVEVIDVDATSKKIIRNKISGLNQLPQNVALDRLLEQLGLSISEVERAAWQHRNSAAHGGMRGNSEEIILNSRLLRLMFHRLLASLTRCSEYYIDYYNLEFPIRCIAEEIPPRRSS